MKKINKIVLLLFMLLWQIPVFSQFNDLPIQNQNDYNVFYKKIQRKYKCSKWFSKKETTLKLLAIFKLKAITPISKEEFTDGSFLKKLGYSYRTVYNQKLIHNNRDFLQRKPIPIGYFSVQSKEKSMAIFPYEYMRFMEYKKFDKKYYEKELKNMFYQNKSYEEYCEIRNNYTITSISKARYNALKNYIWDKGNLFIFELEMKGYGYLQIDTLFIVNDQLEIFVFLKESDEYYVVLPIKEFIEKYWDRFF